jgi:hypothetical protein
MYHTIEKVTIEMSGYEASNVGYALYNSLKESIERHYNNLQQQNDGEGVFNDQEYPKLNLMKMFFSAAGQYERYSDAIDEYKNMFADKRKEREKAI